MMATEDIQVEIMKYLKEYSDEVEDDLEEIFDSTAKEALTQLRSKTKVFKNTAKLIPKGWRTEKSKSKITIYNTYSHTHLLNNGHALVNGGRATAYHFMDDVNDWIVDTVPKRVEKALGG